MKRHGIVASIALLFVPLAACNPTPLSVGSDDGGQEGGTGSDGCTAGGICLSTVSCTTDTDCAALGSTCDPCLKLCGCAGVSDAGEGGTDAAGSVCSTNADCGPNDICGFEASLACTAQGRCFPAPQAVCLAYSAGCACDGTEINIACNGLPSGYDTKPLAHTGACGADAGDGGAEAGGPCSTSADCASSGICGFEDSLACAAQGQCFPAPGVVCNAVLLGCACDGTETNTESACVGLPTGYTLKPLAHAGACEGGVDASSTP